MRTAILCVPCIRHILGDGERALRCAGRARSAPSIRTASRLPCWPPLSRPCRRVCRTCRYSWRSRLISQARCRRHGCSMPPGSSNSKSSPSRAKGFGDDLPRLRPRASRPPCQRAAAPGREDGVGDRSRPTLLFIAAQRSLATDLPEEISPAAHQHAQRQFARRQVRTRKPAYNLPYNMAAPSVWSCNCPTITPCHDRYSSWRMRVWNCGMSSLSGR